MEALHGHFHALSERLSFSDRHGYDAHKVSVEDSGPDDWWLTVQADDLCLSRLSDARCITNSQDPYNVQRYRRLHHALLATSALADRDYDCWVQGLRTTSGVTLDQRVIEGRLLRRYLFTLKGSRQGDENAWIHQMKALFEGGNEGDDVTPLATEVCQSLEVPVRLCFSEMAPTLAAQVRDLQYLTDTILAIQQIEASAASVCSPVRFRLDGVELYIRRYELHPQVLAGLNRLVTTGVSIHFLSLPGRLVRGGDGNEELPAGLVQAWQTVVNSLLSSVCSTAQIGRLEVPPVYTIDQLAPALFSALRTTASIDSVRLEGDLTTDLLPLHSATTYWKLLMKSLFSSHSASSIRSVELSGFQNIPVDALDAVTNYDEGESDEPASPSRVQTLVLHFHANQAPSATDEASSATLAPPQWVPRFLKALGGSLSALAIDGLAVNDTALVESIVHCSQLHSVRVSGAVVSTPQSLLTLAADVKSLDLRDLCVSRDVVDTFFQSLGGLPQSSVERLRIGAGWSSHFSQQTPALMEAMLLAQAHLTYLHVYRSAYASTTNEWATVTAMDGCVVPVREAPLSLAAKLAFIQSMEMRSRMSDIVALNQNVAAIIFQFAAVPRRRRVLVETDPCSVSLGLY